MHGIFLLMSSLATGYQTHTQPATSCIQIPSRLLTNWCATDTVASIAVNNQLLRLIFLSNW